MTSTRDQIVETTRALLEKQGYYATGLNQIVEESGAPKGSLYYYFPDGKEGLTAEAVEKTGRLVERRIRRGLASVDAPGEAVRRFVLTIAHHMQVSEYRAGGPLSTVAMETATSSERLNQACRAAYQSWQAAFEDKLVTSGYEVERARRLALLVMAAIEGATVLSRTYHSVEPLESMAAELAGLLDADRQ